LKSALIFASHQFALLHLLNAHFDPSQFLFVLLVHFHFEELDMKRIMLSLGLLALSFSAVRADYGPSTGYSIHQIVSTTATGSGNYSYALGGSLGGIVTVTGYAWSGSGTGACTLTAKQTWTISFPDSQLYAQPEGELSGNRSSGGSGYAASAIVAESGWFNGNTTDDGNPYDFPTSFFYYSSTSTTQYITAEGYASGPYANGTADCWLEKY
jgi:hypothetical protein